MDELPLRAFTPRPALVTPTTHVARPRFPVIDAHNHLGELIPGAPFAGPWPKRPVSELLELLDSASVEAIVNLDGTYGERLRYELDRYRGSDPDRFIVFAGIEYEAFAREVDIGGYLERQFRDSVAAGAQGLKIWKPLGLTLYDTQGQLVPVDDRRLDPLWAAAGEYGLPVLIHTADPVAFFQPLDASNERWEELAAHPDWHFYGPQFPSFETLIEQFARIVERHPATTFIGAHVGCYAENLAWVGALLDRCPNLYIDISARLAEIGRQPYRARDFFIRYADRVLFGTDTPPDLAMYQLHYRFLETRDEYFDYSLLPTPPQGRWQIYGMDLPADVLERIYRLNAEKVFKRV
jgi:predicted TIM-barrel fold metal-dependent hydrolase